MGLSPFALASATDGSSSTLLVVRDGRVAELAALVAAPPRTLGEALARWDELLDELADAVGDVDAAWRELAPPWRLCPAVPRPGAIYGAGANYRDHVAAMRPGQPFEPDEPYHFLVAPSALAADGDDVVRPAGCTQLDWEVELAVVIGSTARHVGVAEALDHVAGYTIANDISARDRFVRHDEQPFAMDWLRHKSFASFLPLGPALVPARFVPDPQDLGLWLELDDERVQSGHTSDMVFSVAEQISALSQITALEPGDVICTGTPAGTGHESGRYLRPGQQLRAGIDGLGVLRNRVVDAAPA